jgi:hypothetical protein
MARQFSRNKLEEQPRRTYWARTALTSDLEQQPACRTRRLHHLIRGTEVRMLVAINDASSLRLAVITRGGAIAGNGATARNLLPRNISCLGRDATTALVEQQPGY